MSIRVPVDTVIVNATIWTPLGVSVIDRHGQPVTRARITYAAAPESVLAVNPQGAVNCHTNGESTVLIEAPPVHAKLLVRCALVHHFGVPNAVTLLAGGPPAALDIPAYDATGHLMEHVRLQLFIQDSTVVQLRDGLVYGLREGATSIETYSSGKVGGQLFWVKAGALHDSAHAAHPNIESSPAGKRGR